MKTGFLLAPAAAFVFAMGLIAFQPAPVRADDMSSDSGKMMKDDGGKMKDSGDKMKDSGDTKMKDEGDKMKDEGAPKTKSGY